MEDHVPATIIYTHLIINSSINNLQAIKFSHFKGIMQWFLLNLQSFATIATTQFYDISIIPQRSLVPMCRHPPSHARPQEAAKLLCLYDLPGHFV